MYYRSRRITADMTVTLDYNGIHLPVRLVDVSDTGAKIEMEDAMPEGAEVRLLAARQEIPGQVKWCAKRHVGLAFDMPLGSSDVAELAGLAWAV